ncbi:MAG: hypothetical protein WEB58_07310, partial [Planctomycetaceae bacterium]
ADGETGFRLDKALHNRRKARKGAKGRVRLAEAIVLDFFAPSRLCVKPAFHWRQTSGIVCRFSQIKVTNEV